MPLIGANGGLLGSQRSTSTLTGPGLWTPNEQVLLRRANAWVRTDDPYYSNVSLLLHMDGSNGSTTFTDNSSSPLTVTANGNAQISTAQSKFGGASGYFDGSGDFLSIANTTFSSFSTNAFTIELWVYYSSVTTYAGLIETRSSASLANWLLGLYAVSGTNRVDFAYSGARLTSATSVSANTWTHIAVVREGGGTIKMYINGLVDSATASFGSAIDAGTNARIGGTVDLYYLNGYIDDLRITKGVARYTANFTPPTVPFPDL